MRIVDAESGFARSQGTFITVYTLCDDPEKVFDGMVTLRDKLDPPGRMFAPEKKSVRDIVLDAPFSLIDTLRYPWAHDIRSSDLPQTVAGT